MQSGSLDPFLLAKIEKINRRKLQAANASGPFIKDIIAYQVNTKHEEPPIGEFNEYRINSSSFSLRRSKAETEDELIIRMMRYLEDLTMRAILVHIKENFYDAPALQELAVRHTTKSSTALQDDVAYYQTIKNILAARKFIPRMLPEKKDYITRLSINEFALYPHRDRGPLTLKGFEKLLSHVEKLAQLCPENLHLLFGSIPVKTEENSPHNKDHYFMHNIVIFVQGGSLTKLNIFSKAIPDKSDPSYPKTENRAFHLSAIKDESARIAKSAFTSKNSDGR